MKLGLIVPLLLSLAATCALSACSSSSGAPGGRNGANDAGTNDASNAPDASDDAAATLAPAWTKSADTPKSEGRWGMPITYVPDQKRFVGFGGDTAAAVAETWAFAPADATWTKIADSNSPPPRNCHCAAHLPDQNALLLVGGRDDTGPLAPGAWTLDFATNAWTAVTGAVPPGVIGCMAAYMPSVKKAFVFGGGDARAINSDTWSYDPVARAFTKLATPTSPPARADGHAVYDPGDGGRMLLFSGAVVEYPKGVQVDDLWAFDGTTWKALPQAGAWPKGRRVAANAFDAVHRRWFFFGGTLDPQDLKDLWSLDATTGTWTQYADDTAPSARGFTSAGYDPVRDSFFVFGGLQQIRFNQLKDGFELKLR